jgi:hypothetical protein
MGARGALRLRIATLEERPARRDLRSATLEAGGEEGWGKEHGAWRIGQKKGCGKVDRAKGALRPGEIVSEFHRASLRQRQTSSQVIEIG